MSDETKPQDEAPKRKRKPKEPVPVVLVDAANYDLPEGSVMPRATTSQKWQMMRVPRSALTNAPYNPRLISDKAKRKLKKQLAANGHVQPIVWNKQTGNIVGGHQRIALLDSEENNEEYSLEVAAIDVPLKKEMELNIALNNPEAGGEYDYVKLSGLFQDNSLDLESTGFDMPDMFRLFGENPAFSATSAANIQDMAERLAKIRENHDAAKEMIDNTQDPNFFLVMLFPTYLQRLRFTSHIKVEDNRYINGEDIAKLLGIDLTVPCQAEQQQDVDDDGTTGFGAGDSDSAEFDEDEEEDGEGPSAY